VWKITGMSAAEVIDQIEHLPPAERAEVARFVMETAPSPAPQFAITSGDDGLPVVRGKGGIISSRLVREVESLTP
jgi:hypothetical protein